MIARTVLLCGQSLLLAGIAAALAESASLHVSRAAACVDAARLVTDHFPDVLIFELSPANESHVLSLLFKNPRLLLVGLDTERNQAVLVSGQEARPLTLGQVREMVLARPAGVPSLPSPVGTDPP